MSQLTNPEAAESTGPQAGRREWIALAVLMLPLLLVSMDVSVLYFAVPFIAQDLEPTATQQLWIFDVYGFVLAGLLRGGVRLDSGDADRGPRRTRDRGGDADAVDARAVAEPVPRREAAGHRDRHLDGRDEWWGRGRAGTQRRTPRALLVGLRVPGQPAGDGAAAG